LPGETVPPPSIDALGTWHARVEDRLLATLDPDYRFDADLLLSGLDLPSSKPGAGEEGPEAVLSRQFAEDIQDVAGSQSWWWTVGGGDIAPRVLRFRGLPDPYAFEQFLAATAAPVQSWTP
jgi:hypothetical protein